MSAIQNIKDISTCIKGELTMTNTELIRQEIVGRCKEINSIAGDHYNEYQCGQMHTYGSLRAFIDKLPKETLQGREYTIPEGMEAVIENGKVILREKESEDERIRRCICFALTDVNEQRFTDFGVTLKDCLAYLKKQKEQKFSIISAEESLGISPEEYNKIVDECIYDEQKEQKPAEWSDSFEENIRNLLHDKLTWHSEDGSMSSTVFIDDKTLKDIINGIWFYVGKETLKYPNKEVNITEWSEEDSYKVDLIEHIIGCSYRPDEIFKTNNKGISAYELCSWLKNRFTSPIPHWKPSEEQMEALWNTLHPDDPYYVDLSSLYDDLKKL